MKSISTERLAWLYYALELGGVRFDRREFFADAGRPCLESPFEELGIELVTIPAGWFLMGRPAGEDAWWRDEVPQHRVTLSEFQLGKTPVTVGQYRPFVETCEEEKKRHRWEAAEQPVREVSWWEAWLYCRWLGAELPTEAQWEYACRAGSQGPYCFGDDESQLHEHAWYSANFRFREGVGQKKANAFALHDMHGYPYEWCWDWYDYYRPDTQTDPQGPRRASERIVAAGSRVCRGAGFEIGPNVSCRSASRFRENPGDYTSFTGIRVALSRPRAPG